MNQTIAARPKAPVTALLSSCIFFCGVSVGATWPYNAILAVENLGFSNAAYALLIMVSSVASAIASVAVGWFSDRIGDRRLIILAAAALGVASYLLIYFVRTPLGYTIAVGAIMPFSIVLFSQTFAYSRLYYDAHRPERSALMVSVLRTVYSVAWAIAPPLAGFVATAFSIFDLYLVSAISYGLCGLAFVVLPREDPTRQRRQEKAAVLPPLHIAPAMMLGIGGVTLVQVALTLLGLATPLAIVSTFRGTLADVGLYAGLAAALEVPFMLAWGVLAQRFSQASILAINGGILALYAILLFVAHDMLHVFLLQILNGIAVAAILSLSISYLQDSIKGRMGLSTAFNDVVAVVSRLGAAGIFAVVAANGDYRACFIVAAAISVAGALTIVAAQRRRAARA